MNKYVVFKTETWEKEVTEKLGSAAYELLDQYAVPDAVVLRMQDVFAGSMFFQYANSVQTTVEILRAIGGDLLSEECDQLQKISDQFVEFGIEASETETKLPD